MIINVQRLAGNIGYRLTSEYDQIFNSMSTETIRFFATFETKSFCNVQLPFIWQFIDAAALFAAFK